MLLNPFLPKDLAPRAWAREPLFLTRPLAEVKAVGKHTAQSRYLLFKGQACHRDQGDPL